MKHINVALFVVHKGCPHTCSFCNQRSITGVSHELEPWDVPKAVETAVASLDAGAAAAGEIAFFGGSFTMIEREYMISLLEAAHKYVREGLFKGIRISTRPDGINGEICDILEKYGVSAVELGAQSMDNRVLELNERGHTAEQVEAAFDLLRSRSFETGLQMMTGLYGSSDESDMETALKIRDMRPDTVRIYPTVVLKNTKLDALMQSGEFVPKGIEETVELCARIIPLFNEAGIRIIRVGLHSGGNVEDERTGGAYHPALRELCDGRIYLDAALRELDGRPAGKYSLAVAKGCVSKMTGQKKKNLVHLKDLGYECNVFQDDELNEYEVRVR